MAGRATKFALLRSKAVSGTGWASLALMVVQNVWHPLVPKADIPAAWEAIHEILDALPRPDALQWGPTLAGGHAGFALAFGYAALASPGSDRPRLAERALAHLDTSAMYLPGLKTRPGLFSGFTGVAWVVDHFQSISLLEDTGDFNEAVDDALEASLSENSWGSAAELVEGQAGMGIYALGRPAGPRRDRLVRRVIERLEKSALVQDEGTAWPGARDLEPDDHSRGRCGPACIDLGVAHGVPGILGFLGKACRSGFKEAYPMLGSAIRWLMAQRQGRSGEPRFGRSIGPGVPPPVPVRRLSWCYGDLGNAAVLQPLACLGVMAGWRRAILELAMGCAHRKDPWTGIADAGLCHGSIGAAHLFARLHQGTGEGSFLRMSQEAYRKTLTMRCPGEGCGGYVMSLGTPGGEADVEDGREPGLLTGSAGIGIGLLAGVCPLEPGWDGFLALG